MHKTHTLENLNGMNPNTARKLFALLSEEWDGVSWGDFRTFCGRHLACFGPDSRWIPGDLFREYFSADGVGKEAGRAFVRLYSKRAHKSSLSAYESGGNGNGSKGRKGAVKSALKSGSVSKGRKVTARELRAAVNALTKRIESMERERSMTADALQSLADSL